MKYDPYRAMIERYISGGASPDQAERLAKANSYGSTQPLSQYDQALMKRIDVNLSSSDKTSSKEFMNSFRNNKPNMTTEKFFDKSIEYKTDPGAGKVSDKYMDAIKKQRMDDLLKRTGPHNLNDAEYQARENMRSPEGSRSRTAQEYINSLEAKAKARNGKLELIKPEGGFATSAALAHLLLAEGAIKALEIKGVGEGSDTLPPEIQQEKNKLNDLRKKKMFQYLM